MINVKRHSVEGLSGVAASIAAVPTRLMPYAASTALTRVALHAAKKALPDAMRQQFDQPVGYTLNSLRTQPATKDKLVATVAVKNQAAGGVPQENYLLPEVEGGARKRTRTEQALGYIGVLTGGQYAIPGKGMTLDAAGNVRGAEVKTILSTLKRLRGVSATRSRSGQRLRKGRKLNNDLFVGKPKGGNRPDGIWRREGHRIRPLYVFRDQVPTYSKRLDFAGVVAAVARERFASEFAKAAQALSAKGDWQ